MRVKIRPGTLYAAGRVCAVSTKPLCLFLANNYLTANVAQGLAVALLATALAMVGAAAGPHRRFYVRHFARERSTGGFAFYLYAASVGLLIVLGSAAAATTVLYFTRSPVLAVATMLYFASEKLADELLRFRLFEQDFAAWGRASALRSILQVGAVISLLLLSGRTVGSTFVVLSLALGNYVVFVPELPHSLGRTLRPSRLVATVRLARRAALSLAEHWSVWAVALLGAAINYLDRLVVLVVDRATLPLFSLVVMCFSIVPMSIDFFYVSRFRRNFLEQRISVGAAFSAKQFLSSITFGTALAAVICAVVLHFSRGGGEFPLGYVIVVAILQMVVGCALVPMEILYWTRKLYRILHIELSFWVLFTGAALTSWQLRMRTMEIFVLVAACVITRLIVYLAAAARIVQAQTFPSTVPG